MIYTILTISFALLLASCGSDGEPLIQELIFKLKEVLEEMEYFREIFQYTIDEELEKELEEELNGPQEIEEN